MKPFEGASNEVGWEDLIYYGIIVLVQGHYLSHLKDMINWITSLLIQLKLCYRKFLGVSTAIILVEKEVLIRAMVNDMIFSQVHESHK